MSESQRCENESMVEHPTQLLKQQNHIMNLSYEISIIQDINHTGY